MTSQSKGKEGFHTLTPHLTIKNCASAIEFYKKAFGAEEVNRMPGPDGKGIMHAMLKIGDSMLMVNDEFPGMGDSVSPETLGGSASSLCIAVDNIDEVFDRAVKAGATVVMPLANMFWGDRYGKLTDPFGHKWEMAKKVEDLTPEQIRQRGEEFNKQMAGMRK